MTFDRQDLLELLPAVYRLRDAELAASAGGLLSAAELVELAALEAASVLDPVRLRRRDDLRERSGRGPLAALLAVLAEQFGVIEENLAQLYDDQFVETASDWALPYIGDLIGHRPLHDRGTRTRQRAEIAHTIAFRRRKGTASMLEQLARDVTGWNARAVEYFALLATNQSMIHRRPVNRIAPSVREGAALEWLGTAFDTIPRTLDVRRIETGAGRYNVPNVGIFLWRIDAHRLSRSPASPDPADATGRRFRFSPLGNDAPLYTRPELEEEITHLAEPINVPEPITRRRLDADVRAGQQQPGRERLYGAQRSISVEIAGNLVQLARIEVCNLADDAGGWAHDVAGNHVAIDPVLGRLVVGPGVALAAPPRVTFHYGAAGDRGGGEYHRPAALALTDGLLVQVPTASATVQAAIDAVVATGGSGVVEIVESGRYREALTIDVPAGASITLRGADGARPLLALTAPMVLTGAAGLVGGGIVLDGLVIAKDAVTAPAAGSALRSLVIRDCTLVPGRALQANGDPVAPGALSLAVELSDVELRVERSIVGPLRVHEGSVATLCDSIVDAGEAGVAYARSVAGPPSPGGRLEIESSTILGDVHTERLDASNAIFLGDVQARRRQEGCLRFSYAQPGSVVPRRHRCQPGEGEAAGNAPSFTTLRYGAAAYARLAAGTKAAILTGSEDESEMGVFRRLYEPQRESDLRTRLDEYLRVGLSTGIFHAS
jgi:hypothetical protein